MNLKKQRRKDKSNAKKVHPFTYVVVPIKDIKLDDIWNPHEIK